MINTNFIEKLLFEQKLGKTLLLVSNECSFLFIVVRDILTKSNSKFFIIDSSIGISESCYFDITNYKYNSDSKVFFLLKNIESINQTFGNFLLKILEEASNTFVFVCIASNLHNLMPTIKSRSLIHYINIQTQDALAYLNFDMDDINKLHELGAISINDHIIFKSYAFRNIINKKPLYISNIELIKLINDIVIECKNKFYVDISKQDVYSAILKFFFKRKIEESDNNSKILLLENITLLHDLSKENITYRHACHLLQSMIKDQFL